MAVPRRLDKGMKDNCRRRAGKGSVFPARRYSPG